MQSLRGRTTGTEGICNYDGKRPADIAVKVEVDTSDMEKVRSMVDEIKISVDDMIKNLTETKESLKHGADC